MKVQIEHDEHGNIKAIAVAGPRGEKSASLRPRAGHAVSIVEVPDCRKPGDYSHLKGLRQTHRIERRDDARVLVPRQS